jgi:hypothetical protein
MKFHPLLKLLVPLIEALPKCGTTLDDRDAYRVRYKYVHFIFTSNYLNSDFRKQGKGGFTLLC